MYIVVLTYWDFYDYLFETIIKSRIFNLQIEASRGRVKEAKKQHKEAKNNYKNSKSDANRVALEKKKKALERMELALTKLEVQATDKDENKEIALGTSKLNYLDPRISVGW